LKFVMKFLLLIPSSVVSKQALVVQNAIFTLKFSIQYIVDKGNSVFMASLDISKAFDRVRHFKLYNSLLSAGCDY